jgi:hypothetical protein
MERRYREGVRLLGCWDTRVSRLPHAVAVLAEGYKNLRTIVSYPTKTGEPLPSSICSAKEHGAEVFPTRGNFPSIAFSQCRRHVEAQDGFMIPFGFECEEGVRAIVNEAKHVPISLYEDGTLVVCAGSGVTLAGLLLGLKDPQQQRVYAISSGRSTSMILRTVRRFVENIPETLALIPPLMPYYKTPSIRAPFPTHPHYDLKAWLWLTSHVQRLPRPILFWNIGS